MHGVHTCSTMKGNEGCSDGHFGRRSAVNKFLKMSSLYLMRSYFCVCVHACTFACMYVQFEYTCLFLYTLMMMYTFLDDKTRRRAYLAYHCVMSRSCCSRFARSMRCSIAHPTSRSEASRMVRIPPPQAILLSAQIHHTRNTLHKQTEILKLLLFGSQLSVRVVKAF